VRRKFIIGFDRRRLPAKDLQTGRAMQAKDIVRLSWTTLSRNKLRSSLTALGIIIGVAAVISTIAIGQGASTQIQEQIQALGENMIYVAAGSVNLGGVRMGGQATKTLTVSDALAMQRQVPGIAMASPYIVVRIQAVNGSSNWGTRATGISPDYIKIRNWPLESGSMFTDRDVNTAADVCVIGKTVAANLFGSDDPVGGTIRIQNLPFQIVGELSEKGNSPFGQDEDDVVLIPYTTVQKKIAGLDWLQAVMLSADTADDIGMASRAVAGLLRQRHRLRPEEANDFTVQSANDMASAQAQTSQVMTMLLASIGSIALLVGGIGIMNIMLVSVTERTREIGLRMSVGATQQDIERQFLTEAVVLTMSGGFAGVLAGIGTSLVLSRTFGWAMLISASAVALAAFFSIAVGLFFGFYPAYKAAHLDPIVALRAE
jgi:putative ABC transport system permease protein